MRPMVDVGVVTWNTAALSAQYLRRLMDSDQHCDMRLLVHDNASEDGTAEAVARAVPEADVVRAPANLGFAAGVNALLARSEAPWFFALNSDAWPEPGTLGRLVEVADAHERLAVVAPLLLRPDGALEHSTHPFPSTTISVLDAVGGRRLVPRRWAEERCLEGAWHHDRGRLVDWAVGAAWLMRRQAVHEVGGLDTRFFMYVEDLEWCWRARQKGWRVWFEPSAVVRHVGNVSGERRFGDERAAAEQANLLVFLEEAFGPRRARWYRRLQLPALAGKYLRSRLGGDPEAAGYWRLRLRAVFNSGARPGEAAADPPP